MLELREILSKVQAANAIEDIKKIISTYFHIVHVTAEPQTTDEPISAQSNQDLEPENGIIFKYGIAEDNVSLSKANKLREKANAEAMDVLNRVKGDETKLTDEDKNILRKYSGLGGIGLTTNEYYTPDFVASGMWDGLKAMGFDGGNILEPSAGAGVFSGTKPSNAVISAVELSDISGKINQLLHPEDKVTITNFEKFAIEQADEVYDHVIGNPPYGERDKYANDDPEYKDLGEASQYFVERSIRLCKSGGLIAMALPPRLIEGTKFKEWREKLSYQAEFLGAHLLPDGTFNANGTGTAVCVAFWKKHGKDITAILSDTDEETLLKANVIYPDYINGKYWQTDGKKYVHGEYTKTKYFDGFKTQVKGGVQPTDIKTKLGKPFDSRINWDLISNVEKPISASYKEGDSRMINGKFMILMDGKWKPAYAQGQDGNKLDPKMYGVSSTSELEEVLKNPYALTQLPFEAVKNAFEYFPAYFSDKNRTIYLLAARQKPKFQEQVMRGAVIGSMIDAIKSGSNNSIDTAIRDQVVNMAKAEMDKYGHPHKNRALVGLNGKNSGLWNSFASILKKDGTPSDLMTGNIKSLVEGSYDKTDTASTINHLFNYVGEDQITLETFNEFYEGELTKNDLLNDDAIALTPQGYLEPMDKFCSGDATLKSAELIKAIAKLSKAKKKNAAEIAKLESQLHIIQDKRDYQDIEKISVTLNAPWINQKLILDFLHDKGYTNFTNATLPKEAQNSKTKVGGFWGYRFDENGKAITNKDDQFTRQLENYLNGFAVQTSGKKDKDGNTTAKDAKALLMNQFHDLDRDFKEWIVANDHSQEIESSFNDKFNRYIYPAEDCSDLRLNNVSGDIQLKGYQNAAIRRLAEDGKGILGFQMGLGKTFTALGLIAYNQQTGRSKRSCIVVPKSTLENWYHEQLAFNGRAQQEQILFVGLEPELDENGTVIQVPILDNQGNDTGKKRDKVKLLSGSDVTARMNLIPHSSYKTVVMTKEQFSRIPMRPDSKEEYVDRMVENQNIRSTKLAIDTLIGDSSSIDLGKKADYKAAKKLGSFRRKYADEGTTKEGGYPFFEEMLFDSVVIDEAHNYRNSYQGGRESSKLAWLPTAGSAKSSLDMSLKLDYIRANNGGRGAYPMTATVTVNSPTDIYNMLSLAIGTDEWQSKHGIGNVDDFIKVFGDIEVRDIEKLSGELEQQEALVGFKNLTGLRNLFHRWCNLKNADDVGEEVEIPDIIEKDAIAPMSEEQEFIYKELRQQADWWKKASEEERENANISIFGIIRKMDKIATDPDLYHGVITYLFEPEDYPKVKKLVAALPKSVKAQNDDEDGYEADDEDAAKADKLSHNAQLTNEGDTVKLVINASYEIEVEKLLAKFDIDQNSINHPVVSKYAALIENVKNGLKEGKQIIFTEEKTQHNKLARILAKRVPLSRSKIGIINADTISKGKVPPDLDEALEGLEGIAKEFNEDRLQILICNKKAEVGINLHKGKQGTKDVHNLTIPWQPASLRQRIGRAARISSTSKFVRSWIYQADGSFDKFRYETLKRKQDWINDVLSNDGIETAENANADDMALIGDLLAENEAERQQIQATRQAELARRKQAELKRMASNDLAIYLGAGQTANLDERRLEMDIRSGQSQIEESTKIINSGRYGKQTKKYKEAAANIRDQKDRIRRAEKQLKSMPNAINKLKQYRSKIERYIDNGVLNLDKEVLDKPENYVSVGDKGIKRYSIWKAKANPKNGNYEISKGWEAFKFDKVNILAKDKDLIDVIVKVVTHNTALGFAECSLLYPTGMFVRSDFYGQNPRLSVKESEIAVFYDAFLNETTFDLSEIAEKNLPKILNATSDFIYVKNQEGKDTAAYTLDLDLASRIADEIGIEKFREIMKQNRGVVTSGHVESSGQTVMDSHAIYYRDGLVKIVAKSARTLEDEKYYLLPVQMNDELAAKVYRSVIEQLNAYDIPVNKSWEFSKAVPQNQLKLLLGRQWEKNLEQYGNSISDDDLSVYATNALESCINDKEAINERLQAVSENNKSLQRFDFKRVITANVTAWLEERIKNHYNAAVKAKGKFDNLNAISAFITQFLSNERYENERFIEAMVSQRFDEMQTEKLANEEAIRNDLIESFNEFSKRTQQVAEESIKDFLTVYANRPFNQLLSLAAERGAYWVDKSLDYWPKKVQLLIAADLGKFNRYKPISLANSELKIALAMDKSKAMIEEFKTFVVNGLDPLNKPDGKASSAETSEDGSITLPNGAMAEMQVKRNREPLKVIRKVRGREKLMAEYAANEAIAISDSNGFKGKLSKFFSRPYKSTSENPNAVKYQAHWFKSDDGEFINGWWIIKGDANLDELNEEMSK